MRRSVGVRRLARRVQILTVRPSPVGRRQGDGREPSQARRPAASARSRHRRTRAGDAGVRRAGTRARAARNRRSAAGRPARPGARPRRPPRPARRDSAAPGGRRPGRPAPAARPVPRMSPWRSSQPASPASATRVRAMLSICRDRSRPTARSAPGAPSRVSIRPDPVPRSTRRRNGPSPAAARIAASTAASGV